MQRGDLYDKPRTNSHSNHIRLNNILTETIQEYESTPYIHIPVTALAFGFYRHDDNRRESGNGSAPRLYR
jgi:hypothetical protein